MMGKMFRIDCKYMKRDKFMNRICKKGLDCKLSCKHFKNKSSEGKIKWKMF